MAYAVPTTVDFKAYFVRDFPYGTTVEFVTDADISSAIVDAGFNFNSDFFSSQANFSLGYMLLAAHFLVLNLRASSQGVAGQYAWMTSSKGVGPASEGITIPQRILDNPELAMLSKTYYGAKYLMFILPQLSGQIFTVCGGTQP